MNNVSSDQNPHVMQSLSKVSNKPIIWSLFAAGGTIAALLIPVLVFVIALAVPLDLLSADLFSYARLYDLISNPFIKLILFFVISLSLWHAAHRLRITAHDFGLRADGIVMFFLYALAAITTMFLGWILLFL